jgi:hypothetical protein
MIALARSGGGRWSSRDNNEHQPEELVPMSG